MDREMERLADLGNWLLGSTDDDVYEYGYAGLPRCGVCGRVVAAEDCEPELGEPIAQRMCRVDTDGSDPTCVMGLRAPAPAVVGPWQQDPASI